MRRSTALTALGLSLAAVIGHSANAAAPTAGAASSAAVKVDNFRLVTAKGLSDALRSCTSNCFIGGDVMERAMVMTRPPQ